MTYFISAEELKQRLSAPVSAGVVVFDCRFHLTQKALGSEQYQQGHIPGAYYLNLETQLSAPVQALGGRHPLPSAQSFTHTMNTMGVSSQSLIVVYDDSRMAYAARAWWLLRYFGHTQVLILDGGFNAWKAIGGAIDRRAPQSRKGNFKARPQANWITERGEIIAKAKDICLIDSREAKRYAGIEEPIDPVAGHIAGALNYFWQEVTDEQGFVKPLAEQIARWNSLPKHNDLVVYCGSGVTACVNLLALEMSGIEAQLYPGSWSDWCSYLNQPVDQDA